MIAAVPAVAALVWARRRDAVTAQRWLKPACSALFVATFALGHPWPDAAYARWIGAGLLVGVAGDLALLGKARRWFAVGLGAFLVGHVCYAAAFLPRWGAGPGLAAVAAAAGGAALLGGHTLRAAWPLLGSMRIPATVYVGFLAAATVLALAPALGGALGPSRWVPGLGMALFLISDVAVARHRFVEADQHATLWGPPCYFAAQQLLALSAGLSAPA